jgi:hypothetical protein
MSHTRLGRPSRRQSVSRTLTARWTQNEPLDHAYPDLVRRSAELYASDLRANKVEMSPAGRQACDKLLKTLDDALVKEKNLRELEFAARSLDGITDKDRILFVNQYVLGTGWDGAPLIVMGTEAAEDYSKTNAEDLAFHCLYVVLQLAGGGMEILQQMARASTWASSVSDWSTPRRRYDFEPNDLLNLDMSKQRTWRIVAEVAAGSLDPARWRQLVDGAQDQIGLGALTYQIERSAHSALKATHGNPPSDARVRFLVDEVVPHLKRSSAILVLHGFGGARSKQWWPQDQRLIQGFLDHGEPIAWKWDVKVDGQSLEFKELNGRRVIYSRALSGMAPRGPSPLYKETVIGLVHDERPVWPPAT